MENRHVPFVTRPYAYVEIANFNVADMDADIFNPDSRSLYLADISRFVHRKYSIVSPHINLVVPIRFKYGTTFIF